LVESGTALRNADIVDAQGQTLPILNIAGRQFAVVSPDLPGALWWADFWDFSPFRWHRRHEAAHDLRVMGLELNNLRIIEKAVNAPNVDISAAQSDSPLGHEAISPEDFPDWLSGSIMPDGTLYGALHLDREPTRGIDFQEFRL
jgi:hypothetical protein